MKTIFLNLKEIMSAVLFYLCAVFFVLPAYAFETNSLNLITLKQNMFLLSAINTVSVSHGLMAESPDGTVKEIDALPDKIKFKVASMELKIDELELTSEGPDPREWSLM